MVLTVGEFDSSETEVATKHHLPSFRLSSNSNQCITHLGFYYNSTTLEFKLLPADLWVGLSEKVGRIRGYPPSELRT